MDLRNAATVDFATSLNSAIAQILGMALAVILLRLYRRIVFPWTERRLIAAIRRDLALMAAGRLERPAFESRMFDRLHLLQTRYRPGSATEKEQDQVERGALAALRIGINLALLRDAERGLFPAALGAVRDARARLARTLRRSGESAEIGEIADAYATALRALADAPDSAPNRQAAMTLGGIRLLLRQHRGFFAGSVASSSAASEASLA